MCKQHFNDIFPGSNTQLQRSFNKTDEQRNTISKSQHDLCKARSAYDRRGSQPCRRHGRRQPYVDTPPVFCHNSTLTINEIKHTIDNTRNHTLIVYKQQRAKNGPSGTPLLYDIRHSFGIVFCSLNPCLMLSKILSSVWLFVTGVTVSLDLIKEFGWRQEVRKNSWQAITFI